ncbi:MAG: UvrD-helicase domain-containing protein, partial [Anaerotignum sp.]|nr:UvrD-helicase domain-containing protein [Anaerotignum sp.]
MGKKLNENQKRAICHETGPMLVLAGPGSGKT